MKEPVEVLDIRRESGGKYWKRADSPSGKGQAETKG